MVALVVVGLSAARPSQAVMPTVAGTVPAEVSSAFDQGLFDVPPDASLQTSALYPNWKIPVVLMDYADQPMTFTNTDDWTRALFDTTGTTATGSVFDYYIWVSGNRIRVTGKVIATVHLARPKNDYADSSWGFGSDPTRNSYAAVDEALRKCATTIDWSEFDRDLNGQVDMVWFLHSGFGGENIVTRKDLWSITSKMTDWSNGYPFETTSYVPGTHVKEIVNAFTIVPELSAFQLGQRCEIGVFCHEFGHALGLPDLYERSFGASGQNVGVGNWSLMSTGGYGTDGHSPQYPGHLGAWASLYLGWATTIRPSEDGPMALGPLESGGKILDLWFQGEQSNEHFLVENRQRKGFDRNLPDSGLIVYHLNDAQILAGLPSNHVINGLLPALRVVESDGRSDLTYGFNHGDASDPYPGAYRHTLWNDATWPNSRSNAGNVTHLALSGISVIGDSARFVVQVRSPGWNPPRNASTAGLVPVLGPGRGARAGLLPDGGIVAVTSEYVGGRAQILLRARGTDHQWPAAVQVSDSPGAATEPSIGVLPGGDLCVVWSDSRHGANELYFRARVLGVWSAETRLTDLTGYSRSPALGTDDRGGVHIAWHYTNGSSSSIYFMYFPYLLPGGEPRFLSPTGAKPDPPAITVGRNGSSYIVWSDRGVAIPAVWYSHFSPDSGARPAKRMVETMGILPGVAAAVDTAGSLHTIWQVGGLDGNSIHYQIRNRIASNDTVLIHRGDSIQDFGIFAAGDGGMHVIAEAAVAGSSQIVYKEWRVKGDWDVGTTEVTRATDPPAARPMVLSRPGLTTVLYISYGTSGAALVEKERGDWLAMSPTAVPWEEPPSVLALRAGPNPLRAGNAFRVSWSGAPPPGDDRLDVFDVSGRRIASAPLHQSAGRWSAQFSSSVTESWRDGVYYVRAGSGRGRTRFVVVR